MKVKEVLTSRTRQRLIWASRAIDRSIAESRYIESSERRWLQSPDATSSELFSGWVFLRMHRVLKWPVALMDGSREFFRKR